MKTPLLLNLSVLLLTTSCGVAKNVLGTRDREKNTTNYISVQDQRALRFRQCSNQAFNAQCTQAPNSATQLQPYAFYDRYCYSQYLLCLRN
jgi:hypothetical protein